MQIETGQETFSDQTMLAEVETLMTPRFSGTLISSAAMTFYVPSGIFS
jgi:hypothetical protein